MNSLLRPVSTLTVRAPFFDQIRCGQKIIEGRPFTSKYADLIKGDFIKIVENGGPDKWIHVEILRLTKYDSFLGMLKNEGLKNCLPGVSNFEEGVRIYHNFPDYKTLELNYGVIAIAVKVQQQYSEIQRIGSAKL